MNLLIILLFLILIPITVNAITLYLLDIIEKKDKISNHKLIPSILNRYINYLIKDGNNKELLNYYKSYSWAELKFYVVILVFVLCVFTYFSYEINDVSSNISLHY